MLDCVNLGLHSYCVPVFWDCVSRNAITSVHRHANLEGTEMTHEELRELETARRKALWVLASLLPGDLEAAYALAILDNLDNEERNDTLPSDAPLGLNDIRDSVTVQYHRSGIDIILEQTIPQPWRERFHQASIGSTRLVDGPYVADWHKFLVCWETEMQHLKAHRAARSKPKLD